MLDSMDSTGRGGVVTTQSLAVELQAGGLTQEHVEYVSRVVSEQGMLWGWAVELGLLDAFFFASPPPPPQVVDHLNHEGRGIVEFLDYLTYVPLFVEIHDSICGNPLDVSRTK